MEKSHDHSSIKSSKKIGPGYWAWVHIKSSKVKTPEDKALFIKDIKLMQETFPCATCKIHFGEYLLMDNPNNARDVFEWGVTFHNSVNYRLGKEQLSLADARSLYNSDFLNSCEGDCSEEEKQPTKNNKNFKSPGNIKSPKNLNFILW